MCKRFGIFHCIVQKYSKSCWTRTMHIKIKRFRYLKKVYMSSFQVTPSLKCQRSRFAIFPNTFRNIEILIQILFGQMQPNFGKMICLNSHWARENPHVIRKRNLHEFWNFTAFCAVMGNELLCISIMEIYYVTIICGFLRL